MYESFEGDAISVGVLCVALFWFGLGAAVTVTAGVWRLPPLSGMANAARTTSAPTAAPARTQAGRSRRGRSGRFGDSDDIDCADMGWVRAGKASAAMTWVRAVGAGARRASAAPRSEPEAEAASGRPRAWAMSAAVAGRSAGSLARAALITLRIPRGTVTGNGGGGWLRWATAVATSVSALNGG